MTNKCFYVATPIYYPNGKLHLGHAYTTVLSDVLARYKRLQGYDVFFSTGSDEHGQKIVKQAQLAQQTPQAFTDTMVAEFKKLWEALNVGYSRFIRTTSSQHMVTVQNIFSRLLAQGDIYLGKYEGWYCISCEEFVTKTQMTATKRHLICDQELKFLEEESYFFNVAKYQDRLLTFYQEHPHFIYPESRIVEMINNFMTPSLQNLSVTRTSFTWGVKVKEHSEHIIYVWIDALINYISTLGYLSDDDALFAKYWSDTSEIVHFLGKEITRFHAIYWPILLMALDLRLPNKLIVHAWITIDNDKMAKSKDNSVNPLAIIDNYGSDALRFFLVHDLNISRDSNYTAELLLESYNAHLVNNFGNLFSRTMTMINKYYQGQIPEYKTSSDDVDVALETALKATIIEFQQKMDAYLINEAVIGVVKLLHQANKYIETKTPWKLSTDKDPNLAKVINNLAQVLKVSAYLLAPVLVTTSEVVLKQLNIDFKVLNFSNLSNWHDLDNIQIDYQGILFPRK